MQHVVRIAHEGDIPELMRIRAAVRENRLVSRVIGADEISAAISISGRGWVVEAGEGLSGKGLAGFAIGNRDTGNIWALFVDPDHERRGIGRALHAAMIDWLFAQGLQRLHLSTEPGTRAETFYRTAGWSALGLNADGEQTFELTLPAGS